MKGPILGAMVDHGFSGTPDTECNQRRKPTLLNPGTVVVMTKGYRGVRGVITEKAESSFEFYVIRLDNDIHIVAGPSAFEEAASVP